jgi:hypothetical protein
MKSAGVPVNCNDVAPPRLGCKWYCNYLEMRECHDPAILLIDNIQNETIQMSDVCLEKSMYTNKLLEEFVTFQDSQGKRKAYLMEKN